MDSKLVVFSLLTAFILAGCSSSTPDEASVDETEEQGDGGDGSTTTTRRTTSTTSTSSSGEETGTAGNNAPTASLAAAVTTGTLPLNVTFSVGGSDDDGDELSFTLDFADGTEPFAGILPDDATVTHLYQSGGTYMAKVTVTDTNGGSAEAALEIVAVAETAIESWYFSSDQDGDESCITDQLVDSLDEAVNDTFVCVAQVVHPTLGDLTVVATAQAPSRGFPEGTEVNGRVHLNYVHPSIGDVYVGLGISEGNMLGETTVPVDMVGALDTAVVDFSFTTSGEIKAGEFLALYLSFDGHQAQVTYGGGPDAPTGFTLGAPYAAAA